MANFKFPAWQTADETLIRMASDMGAHVYVPQHDHGCTMYENYSSPLILLIPHQWFRFVPPDCSNLFNILYNEFVDNVFFSINAKEIIDEFKGEPMGWELRSSLRNELYRALKKYESTMFEKWDGDINHPRNLRDKFLTEMGCDEKPLIYRPEMISQFVEEEDRIWVV